MDLPSATAGAVFEIKKRAAFQMCACYGGRTSRERVGQVMLRRGMCEAYARFPLSLRRIRWTEGSFVNSSRHPVSMCRICPRNIPHFQSVSSSHTRGLLIVPRKVGEIQRGFRPDGARMGSEGGDDWPIRQRRVKIFTRRAHGGPRMLRRTFTATRCLVGRFVPGKHRERKAK